MVDHLVDNDPQQVKPSIPRILGKRWTLMILRSLSERKAARFSEIKKKLANISGTMLSERLLELEKEGLVAKKIYSEVPPRGEYSLTDRARELESILNELDRWYVRWNAAGRCNEANELLIRTSCPG